MKRVERRRLERVRRLAKIIGLSFALGALMDVALTWRLHEFDIASSTTSVPPGPGGTSAQRTFARTPAPEPAPVATTGVARGTDVEVLRDRELRVTVEGIDRDDLRDTFPDRRGGARKQEALDIMAPRGTPGRRR